MSYSSAKISSWTIMSTAINNNNNNNNDILFLKRQYVDVRRTGKKDIVQPKLNRKIF